MPSLPLVLAAETVTTKLLSLSLPDMVIIVAYFVMVLGIGWYLKWQTQTGEDFFLAGREMTAWIAGLSFLSANLGSLELMGWAGAAYQYGILATHWYWIGAIPAMLFLGIVMMPFYYISKTHSVPGYLQLRFGENSRAFAAISFSVLPFLSARPVDRAFRPLAIWRMARSSSRSLATPDSSPGSWSHRLFADFSP